MLFSSSVCEKLRAKIIAILRKKCQMMLFYRVCFATIRASADTIKKPADRIRMSAGAIRKTTSLRGVCKAVFVLRIYALRGKYLEFKFAIVGDRLAIDRQYIQIKTTIVEDVERVFEEIFCSTH